jgi:hypothetical protein
MHFGDKWDLQLDCNELYGQELDKVTVSQRKRMSAKRRKGKKERKKFLGREGNLNSVGFVFEWAIFRIVACSTVASPSILCLLYP